MAAQQPRGLRLSYARLHSARATVGITPRPGALPIGPVWAYFVEKVFVALRQVV
jgi:hypothetical protein